MDTKEHKGMHNDLFKQGLHYGCFSDIKLIHNMWPDLQKPNIMVHSKIFSIKYKAL